MSHVASKLVNAAAKMGKLIGTDLYLDGQGTNSDTLSIDGLQGAVDNGNNYTTYGNVTRSDLGVSNGTNNAGLNGYVASGATFTLNAIQLAFGSCWFGNEHVDFIAGQQRVWDFQKVVPSDSLPLKLAA